jgi:hypothetical protein
MIVESIWKPLSVIEARVELSQFGEGVPCQKKGKRCGVVAVVSAVSIVPDPVTYCVPGATHGGGDCALLTTAR